MGPPALGSARPGRRLLLFLAPLLTGMLLITAADASEATADSYVAVYGGRLSADPLFETLTLQASFEHDHRLRGFAVGHTLARYRRQRSLAVEVQYNQHYGVQEYEEAVLVAIYRWAGFSWDHHVRTTFAVGEGVSWLSELSQLEARRHTNTSRWLNYLLFEATLAPPSSHHWRFLIRVHHRSGIYGLINDVHGASNAMVLGIRYDF